MPSGTKLLSFRAGKMNMSGTTVTADPTKGLIELYRDPDQMVYFVWRSRATNNVAPGDELMVIAGDYTWKRVHQCKSAALLLLLLFVSLAYASLTRPAALAAFFCCPFTAKRGSFGCRSRAQARMPSAPTPPLLSRHTCVILYRLSANLKREIGDTSMDVAAAAAEAQAPQPMEVGGSAGDSASLYD
jgi:hypothetical protein